jgi:hypothetical protein
VTCSPEVSRFDHGCSPKHRRHVVDGVNTVYSKMFYSI